MSFFGKEKYRSLTSSETAINNPSFFCAKKINNGFKIADYKIVSHLEKVETFLQKAAQTLLLGVPLIYYCNVGQTRFMSLHRKSKLFSQHTLNKWHPVPDPMHETTEIMLEYLYSIFKISCFCKHLLNIVSIRQNEEVRFFHENSCVTMPHSTHRRRTLAWQSSRRWLFQHIGTAKWRKSCPAGVSCLLIVSIIMMFCWQPLCQWTGA